MEELNIVSDSLMFLCMLQGAMQMAFVLENSRKKRIVSIPFPKKSNLDYPRSIIKENHYFIKV